MDSVPKPGDPVGRIVLTKCKRTISIMNSDYKL
jgi:hypothetical protein